MNTVSPDAGTAFGLQLVAALQLPPAVLVQTMVAALARLSAARAKERNQGANRVRQGLLIGVKTFEGLRPVNLYSENTSRRNEAGFQSEKSKPFSPLLARGSRLSW